MNKGAWAVHLVWMPDRGTTGQVLKEVAPHSLVIETSDGTFQRN